MNRTQINYESDFHAAIAEALANQDIDLLDDVASIVSGWMESEREHNARMSLIEAARNILEIAMYA